MGSGKKGNSLAGAMLMDRMKKIQTLLPKTMGAERFHLRRDYLKLKRIAKKSSADGREQQFSESLERRVKASVEKRKRRMKKVPAVSIDENLPIAAKTDEIALAIKQNPVVIISGETGSGKTTQIPKICLAAGRGIDGMIGCTQPRRIAATTVAARISEELGEQLGQSVGYKIRFDEKIGKDAYIKIMTDGVLLAEAQSNPFLNEYDALIIDEAHERSLNIDFVLGILKNLIAKRKDLKLIITSATIDTEKFSMAFDNAPVIEVSGRMYPVAVKYWPAEEFQGDEEVTHVEMAVSAVENVQKRGPFGDILVFMPTEQDIRETCEMIEGRDFMGVKVFPLFARLSSGEQKRVFSSFPGRKIIVATNVAETSITIPGIKYVVDTGLARILRYSPRTRTTALPVEEVSKSSADQRMGRCGRVENGVCIRLYSEEEYEKRSLYTPPEILRSNLAEVILRMISLNLGDIDSFPFIDRPDSKSISDGFALLEELGAIRPLKSNGKKRGRGKFGLSSMGRFMAQLPLDPRISRMLIEARKEGVVSHLLILAAALSIRDPRERPVEKADEADRKQARFADQLSDFSTMLNLWKEYRRVWKKYKSAGRLKRFCKDHFLSFKRMREWRDIHEQLKSIMEENNVEIGSSAEPGEERAGKGAFSPLYGRIHRCILSGFLSGVAQKREKNIYGAAKNREVMIFPGSSLFNHAGDWIVAAEMVMTSRLFARTCATIDVGWIEAAARGLCRYSYFDPRWDPRRGEVIASMQVSLFGLVVAPARQVSYGKINPDEASEVFIRNALIDGKLRENFEFYEHNRDLIEKVVDLENRLRRRDILVSEDELVRFYQSRLGKKVYDFRTLKKIIKRKGGDGFLEMKRADIINYDPESEKLARFPNHLNLGGNSFACRYRFEPGGEKDGVTVKVPATAVSSVRRSSIDWHVPGLLEEKINFLLKGLPKKYRRKLVPIADTARIIVEEMPRRQGPLITALSRFVFDRFQVDVPASAWPGSDLPDYLKLRISVMDANGSTIRSGRGREVLGGKFSQKMDANEIAETKRKWEKEGISKWDFGDLPESITVNGRDDARWMLYPGLVSSAEGDIRLRLFTNNEKAIFNHKQGVLALYKVHLSKELKFLKKNLALPPDAQNYASLFGGNKKIEKSLLESVLKDFFSVNIRDRKSFLDHAQKATSQLAEAGIKKKSLSLDILKAVSETRRVLFDLESDESTNSAKQKFFDQIRQSLSSLVPENFLELYDDGRLLHLPRYIQAVEVRVRRGAVNLEKDSAKAAILGGYVNALHDMLQDLNPDVSREKRSAVEEFFWLLEEFKVSVFAQELKTHVPVSEKRLKQKMKDIKRMA